MKKPNQSGKIPPADFDRKYDTLNSGGQWAMLMVDQNQCEITIPETYAMQDKLNNRSRKALGYKIPNEVYEENHSPFLVVDLLQTMMREGIYDLDLGLTYYLDTNNPDDEWHELWDSLKLLDQLVLKDIICGEHPLYHKETYALLGGKLGLENVTRGMVQSSVKRLREQGILNNEERGLWLFESRGFAEYVSAL